MKKDKEYLQDIVDAISDIEKFIEGTTEKEFCRNKEKQYAVVRALEIIGEATKNLSRDLRTKHGKIPWRDIAGMRDKLIHMYFGVKLDLIWITIKDKLPELKGRLCSIMREL
jgi:uncharacterized protein with HEPN domain